MLSKSKGQVLCMAAAFHVLFWDAASDQQDTTDTNIPPIISNAAIVAAQNFVETCCQHAAFMGGCGKVDKEISRLISGNITH